MMRIGDAAAHAPAVRVWAWPLTGEPAPADSLNAEERARAARFATPALAARWTAARHGLRMHLGAAMQAQPERLRFAAGAHGKPFLAEPGAPHFNLSHSGGYALLGVCAEAELGVDVEDRARLDEDVIAAVLTARERAALAAAPEAARGDMFLRFWTLKEALMKATGLGFSLPPLSLEFELSEHTAPILLNAGDGVLRRADWCFAELIVSAATAAAIAVRAPAAALVLAPPVRARFR